MRGYIRIVLLWCAVPVDTAVAFVAPHGAATSSTTSTSGSTSVATRPRRASLSLTLLATTSADIDNNNSNNNDDKTMYDLAVIGGGVVGVQAALLAAQAPYHKKVILLDAPRASGMLMNEATGEDLSLGGPTGLFSKALRDTSKRIKVSTLRGMGLREDSVWNEIINSCTDLASSNAQDIIRQLEMANVDYFQGFAAFAADADADADDSSSSGTSTTDGLTVSQPDGSTQTIHAHKILIATGSHPFRPAGIPFDGKRIFDSDSINTLSYLPKSIAITGSGIIAVEFAKIFANLGADVTLIIRDQIPRHALMKIGLDKDVAALLVADLIQSGIKIERGAQVKAFEVSSLSDRVPIKIQLEAKGGQALPPGQTHTEIKCDA
jgi:NAD(P) transhydrogenase